MAKNAKKTKESTGKKGKKSNKADIEAHNEGAVAQPHFAHKRKKKELDWLIFPIIIVIILIILFVIKISVELIKFSQDVANNNTTSVNYVGENSEDTLSDIQFDATYEFKL